MIKKFNAKDIKRLELSFEGSSDIIFNKSDNNELYIKVEFTNDDLEFLKTNDNEYFNLKVVNPKIKDDLSILNEIFHNVNSFTDIIKNISKCGINHKNKRETLKIIVNLPHKLDYFNLKTNDSNIILNNLNAIDVNIKGNNLNAELVKNISIEKCNIKVNNAHLAIMLTNKLKDMSIKANNANILFYRDKNAQDIGVKCIGNNIAKIGALEAERSIVFCKLNNGKIKVN